MLVLSLYISCSLPALPVIGQSPLCLGTCCTQLSCLQLDGDQTYLGGREAHGEANIKKNEEDESCQLLPKLMVIRFVREFVSVLGMSYLLKLS